MVMVDGGFVGAIEAEIAKLRARVEEQNAEVERLRAGAQTALDEINESVGLTHLAECPHQPNDLDNCPWADAHRMADALRGALLR